MATAGKAIEMKVATATATTVTTTTAATTAVATAVTTALAATPLRLLPAAFWWIHMRFARR
jgi:hypothetical protein